uniref:Uncharacterized protein n=1 Tax=Rhizophora mucronata TaxID=61149 RepID=A0A2P2J6T6_RHIMU
MYCLNQLHLEGSKTIPFSSSNCWAFHNSPRQNFSQPYKRCTEVALRLQFHVIDGEFPSLTLKKGNEVHTIATSVAKGNDSAHFYFLQIMSHANLDFPWTWSRISY